MELFSEIYSCYFKAMRRVLEEAGKKAFMTYQEISAIINETAFSDSGFFMMPLLEKEWHFFEKQEDYFFSKLGSNSFLLPMTRLQQAWLKALLEDKRVKLFLDQNEITLLTKALADVPPLFTSKDIYIFDQATDGDPYDDPCYIHIFRGLVDGIRSQSILKLKYNSGKGNRSCHHYLPQQLNYSSKDDKFRMLGLQVKKGQYEPVILNVARIEALYPTNIPYNPNWYHRKKRALSPLVLRIYKGRNALERCMLQFASMEKETEYEEETDTYLCRIYYDIQDEMELLIRVLSFGPVVQVLGPEKFLNQMKEKIKLQMTLTDG
ncbi:WYL domain-containing protein [Alkaliphilus crotonatoxidans]